MQLRKETYNRHFEIARGCSKGKGIQGGEGEKEQRERKMRKG